MTRVFYDADRRSLFIAGVPTAFAPKSLTFIRTGDVFEIWIGSEKRVLMAPYTGLQDASGANFANADAAAQYLDATFAMDPLSGIKSYTHTQAMPSAMWTIAHSLGRHPSNIYIEDTAGEQCIGAMSYPDNNTAVVTFSAAFAGVAYLL